MRNALVQQSGKDMRLLKDFWVLFGNSLGITTQPAQLVLRSRFEHGSSLTRHTTITSFPPCLKQTAEKSI